MGKENSLIELKDIVFSYPGRPRVLDEVNFSLAEGERVIIQGSNGSGKTTLLHIMMGLLKPNQGEVKIFGRLRTTESDFIEVRERVGLLFQDSEDQLFCPTVAEDVAFGPLNLRKTHEETHRIVWETLELLGLNGFEDRISHKLSFGEKRLVSLATILAMEPEVLLLDEPTLALDEETSERIVDFLNNNNHFSCCIISHDPKILQDSHSSVYVIQKGKFSPRK